MIVFEPPCSQYENALHGETLWRHSLRPIRSYSLRPTLPTAPVAEEEKLGQAPLGCQGVNCSLTTINDATDGVTDSATDTVDHAANGIGGTPHDAANCVSDAPDNTTLRPKISTRSEYPA